ncbi:MAG: tetratricopeptide repeat protein [Ardenticatenaceae bacterium]|nr:tetratricopeptide repeat protein [Ardenticatenaceae bacterium]
MTLQLTLLGQPRVQAGDEPNLDFAAEKWLALLAYLAITGDSYARPQLEALLWGESAAENAQTSLRTAVYNINKRLPGLLQTSRKLVWFAPERPFTLDVQQFRDLIQKGDSDNLAAAVALYRGDLLAGLTLGDAPEFELWLLQERERLRLQALTALEQLIDQCLRAGQIDDAIAYSRRLLEIEPWRESVHRQLMRLLARSGDSSAALRQYQQCRDMLAAELGVDPMPETEALYQRIVALRQRPPARPLPTAPPLVGRASELAQLTAHLADPACRLVAITGLGGIGKTSLALALAARQQRAFLDGVCFVRLGDLASDALLDTAVAEALDLAIPPGAAPRQFLGQTLAARELLLVLDGAEHLLTAVTELAQALLAAAPELKIVLTSREAPRLRTAWVLPLAGLPLPEKETAVSPAIELFAQLARRVQPEFDLAAWRPHVVALCRLLQGSPLGIELAAAQLDLIDCAALVAQVETATAELAVDFADMPPRHRSLRALFDHSWRQLAPAEQVALARLAVFRGGFTAVSAAALEVSAPILRTLLAKSLLHGADGRFALHALIRQFALARLDAPETVYAQHARYFSQQLHAHSSGHLPAQPQALLAELDNIRAMWQWAIAQQATALLAEAAHGLARLYAVTNQFAEGQVLFAQAVAGLAETAVPQAAPIVWGMLLGRYAMFLFRTGDLPAARDAAERSVAVLRGREDAEALAFSLNLLGTLHIQSGAFDTAVPLLQECAALYRQLSDPGLLKPLVNLSSLFMRRGDYALAIAQLHEALPLAEALGDQRGMTHILNNLGANYLALGDLDAAREQFAACLPLAAEMAYQPVRMVAHQNLAEVHYRQGAWQAAIDECAAGLAIATEIGDTVQRIRIEKIEALALFAAGEPTQAWQILRRAVQAGFAAETLPALMDVLTGVGALLLEVGETATAVPLLQFIAAHPATERQYAQEATDLLAQASAAPDPRMAERPLADLIAEVLASLPV